MTDAWTIVIPGRPPLLNQERSAHWRAHRTSTAAYRLMACGKAKALGIPRLEQVTVTSWPTYRDGRSWPDVAAWAPATKAVIDGLVDARVLWDDGPRFVVRMTFLAPRLGDDHALFVRIERATPAPTTEGALS